MSFLHVPDMDLLRCVATGKKFGGEPSPGVLAAMDVWLRQNGYRDDNPEVFEAIKRYGAAELEKKNRRGLFLKGDCGIGKTLGMSFLAAKFGWPVISAVEFETAYLTKEREEFDNFIDARDFFGNPAPVVVIDDLGAENLTTNKYGTITNVMAYVLERRYRIGFSRDHSRTLVACNLPDAEIRERYGYRIDSRLDEMMEFAIVHGKSLRREP